MQNHPHADMRSMVMAMVMARFQRQGKHLCDMTSEEIQTEIDSAIADLKLAESVDRS